MIQNMGQWFIQLCLQPLFKRIVIEYTEIIWYNKLKNSPKKRLNSMTDSIAEVFNEHPG